MVLSYNPLREWFRSKVSTCSVNDDNFSSCIKVYLHVMSLNAYLHLPNRCDSSASTHTSAPPGWSCEPSARFTASPVQSSWRLQPTREERRERGDAAGRYRAGDVEWPRTHEHLGQQCQTHGDAETAKKIRGKLWSYVVKEEPFKRHFISKYFYL